jgi:hypothetical protein
LCWVICILFGLMELMELKTLAIMGQACRAEDKAWLTLQLVHFLSPLQFFCSSVIFLFYFSDCMLFISITGASSTPFDTALLHGCLMIIAWAFCISFGVFTARYVYQFKSALLLMNQIQVPEVLLLVVPVAHLYASCWYRLHRNCILPCSQHE